MMPIRHQKPNLPTEVLARLPSGWRACRLTEETTNPLWRLESAAGAPLGVWRQFAPAARAPGVNRARERRIMEALQSFEWMPDLQVWTPQGMLLPWVDGVRPEAEHLNDRQRAALLSVVIELWRHPLPDVPAWDYPALVRQYADACAESAGMAALAEQLVANCALWPRAEPCLMHHDLHPGNLLLSGQQWTLLDWEFAARGNPWIDAVCLDRWLALSADEKARLEPLLASHAVPDNPWRHYRDWVEGLETLWYGALNRG